MKRWAIAGLGGVASLAATFWLMLGAWHDPAWSFLGAAEPAQWILYPQATATRIRPVLDLDTVFRTRFELSSVPERAELRLRAFRRASLSLNGRPIAAYEDPRSWKEEREIDIAAGLRRGDNELVVTVWNDRGPPALWLTLAAGERTLASDETWETSLAGATWRSARRASSPAPPVRLDPQPPPAPLTGLARRAPQLVGFALASALALWSVRRGRRRLAATGSAGARAIESRIDHALLIVMALATVALVANNSASLARTDGFDAKSHLDYVQFLLEHGRVPWPEEGWTFYHPPLYYALGAGLLASAGLDTLHVKALPVLRSYGVVIAVAQLFFVLRCLALIFPDHPGRRRAALVVAAVLPMQLALLQFPTNEVLASALAALAIWLTLRWLNEPRCGAWSAAGIGACLGAAMLAKFSTITVVTLCAVAMVWRLIEARRGWGRGLCVLAALTASGLAVCGWRFVGVARRWGLPFVSNWDPRISTDWWQDPGYQTLHYFTGAGRALFSPYFSGAARLVDGLYATLWGDGLLSGRADLWSAPPWNFDGLAAGYLLALLPTLALLAGAVAAALRLLRRPSAMWLLLVGLLASVVPMLVYLTLRIPAYSMAKAFYALAAILPLAALIAWGIDLLAGGRVWLRSLLLVVLGTWALNAYTSFWIPRGSAAAEARLARLTLTRDPAAAEAHLRLALAADPEDSRVRAVEARWLMEQRRRPEAEAQLRRIVAQEPLHVDAQRQLVSLLVERGALDEAAELARRALALDASDAALWTLLARIEAQRGRVGAAGEALREALAVNPYDAAGHLSVGAWFESRGEFDAAVVCYRRALRIQPGLVAAQAAMTRLLEHPRHPSP